MSNVALTPSGSVITCDGCRAAVERVTDAMKHPLPAELAMANYGRTDVHYIVCAPMPSGDQPCLTIAQLNEELYRDNRCRVPGCDGSRCWQGRLRL